jgi:hypothetical protein
VAFESSFLLLTLLKELFPPLRIWKVYNNFQRVVYSGTLTQLLGDGFGKGMVNMSFTEVLYVMVRRVITLSTYSEYFLSLFPVAVVATFAALVIRSSENFAAIVAGQVDELDIHVSVF